MRPCADQRKLPRRGIDSARLAPPFLLAFLVACLVPACFRTSAQAQRGEPAEISAARALLDAGKLAEAESALRAFLDTHAASAEARFLLGFTLFREDKPKDSLAEYTHAAHLQTPSAADLRIVALDYVLLEDYPDAEKWLNRAVAWNPQDSETWYSLGRVKQSENRFAEAVDCFERALALTPRSVKIENNLGLAYEGLNRPDDAVAAYRQAISWQADAAKPSEQPLLNLAVILVDRGETAEALPLLKRAEAIAPGDAKIHGTLGRLYARAAKFPEAQAEYEQATALSPNSAPLHFQLGQVYRREGLAEKAKEELNRAAALDATHSTPDRP